jgi:hypothetical protein
MQLVMAATAQGDEVRLVVAAAFLPGHEVMVLQIVGR